MNVCCSRERARRKSLNMKKLNTMNTIAYYKIAALKNKSCSPQSFCASGELEKVTVRNIRG